MSTFRQFLISCVLLTFGVGIYTPKFEANTPSQIHPVTAGSLVSLYIENSALPPDIGGKMPALPMSGYLPVAYDDSFTTDEDTAFLTGDVLLNDKDIENDDLSVDSIDTTGTIGLVTDNGDGTFDYDPNGQFESLAAGASAKDSFEYTVSDGTGTDTATVTITINGVNDLPIAVDDNYVMKKGDILEIGSPGVLENDTDIENEILQVKPDEFDSNGKVILNSDGSFIYTPDPPGYIGVNDFNYQVCDVNADCAVAEVRIEVVSNIVLTNDIAVTNEDHEVVIDVLANDLDPDGDLDPSSLVIFSQPANGSAVIGPGTGETTYTPNLNFNGLDEFNYIICGSIAGQLVDCKIASVIITVISINDPPIASDDNYYTDKDQTLSVAAPGLLANDSDVETPIENLLAVRITNVSQGQLNLSNDGSFSYIPPQGFIGLVSFTYQADDGELVSNIARVTISVGIDVDPPTITWLSPGIQPGEWVDVGPMIFPLIVDAKDNVQVAYVNFRRWDPTLGDNGDWVFLGSVSAEPFRIDLDTSTLQLGYNQITAEAYDTSGNYSEAYIFLKRWGGLVELPLIVR